jgi:hypothetical protein
MRRRRSRMRRRRRRGRGNIVKNSEMGTMDFISYYQNFAWKKKSCESLPVRKFSA